jgi:prepilin-type processing-associated H-X9-DG protein
VPFRTNAFIVARTLGYTTLNVVFVDGHAMSDNIDEVWHRMFKRVFYIRHLKPTTCFEKAIFIPFGCVGLAMCKFSTLLRLALDKLYRAASDVLWMLGLGPHLCR